MVDAGAVGEAAEDGRADAAHAKGQAEEQAGDEADLTGDQFLGIDEDGGEGRGEDKAYKDREDGSPEEVGIGEEEGEGGDPEDRQPDDVFAAEAVPDGAADQCAGGDGEQEDE